MEYLATAIGVLTAIVGWFISGVVRTKDRMSKLEEKFGDLKADCAGLKARSDAHDGSMADLKREIADIRENMVRRHDLDQIADAIGKRIDDALRR